jgi:hypothetical protein
MYNYLLLLIAFSSCGGPVLPCEQTDGQTHLTKLIVAYRILSNASKERYNEQIEKSGEDL